MRKITTTLLVLGFIMMTFVIPGQTQAASIGMQVATRGSEQFNLQRAHGTLDGRFVAGDNGIVTDTETGLEWFVGPDRNTTWNEANDWVESVSVDGGAWKMPTRDELKTLYAEDEGTHNMSALFQTTGWFVWTSETMSSPRRSYAWGFSFRIGGEYWPPCTYSDPARVFAVRSAR